MKSKTIIGLMITCLLCSLPVLSCNHVSPTISADYSDQPSIPMYSQLLLKGPVSSVEDNIVSSFGVVLESYGFDKSQNLIYYAINGEEQDSYSDLRSISFATMSCAYAYFVFPDMWQEQNEAIDYEIDPKDGIQRRIEYAWDSNGLFTDIRVYKGGSLIDLEGETNLANLMYDANDFPIVFLSFDGEAEITCRNTFSYLDEYGNPCKIDVEVPKGHYTIYRNIRYY